MSRYYDPTVSQFLSPDTADYLDPETIGGVDLYAYGLNNPVMYVDPTGHFPVWAIVLLAVATVAVLYVAVAETMAVIESIGAVEKYRGAQFEEGEYGAILTSKGEIDSAKLVDAETRMKVVNQIWEEKPDLHNNWTKAQLYRELKYHYAGTIVFNNDLCRKLHDSAKSPYIESEQTFFESYVRRFLGNLISIFFE